uniref:Hemerythrin-like domain-containing protein n=1 Tax=Calcidiscus leptoporus TaxID=127549 RepID=A0A7S0JH62_9EUKA|mmetsp:Transcript_58273/g.133726  ORF Transcript_58273/g.133726 Transcript_58273/m.133726 type:complete len:278 (+) Transcript_58273:227-1060(+)
MDAWAASYGSAAAFVCVSCAGPHLATQFGNQLRLRHCHNTWVDEDEMPAWGQLGCNGFIVLDGSHSVVCRASPAFLEVREAAFRHVETLLDALIGSKAVPQLSSGRVDPAVGGKCAEVRFGEDEEVEAEEGARKRQATTDSSAIKVPSVKVAVLDEEHAECEAALALLAERQDAEALRTLLSAYEKHFAHEEALLDAHLYEEAGAAAGGFSAAAGQRRSHFADHKRLLAELDGALQAANDLVPARFVDAVLRSFEQHANMYDTTYAEPLARALAAAA